MSQAKESACAMVQALQRQLEDAEEDAAEKLRTQQRVAAEKKAAADKAIAAAKADCATAVSARHFAEHIVLLYLARDD